VKSTPARLSGPRAARPHILRRAAVVVSSSFINHATRAQMQLILFNIFNGLIVGAFYALMALGLR